jgi:hypothetical protein
MDLKSCQAELVIRMVVIFLMLGHPGKPSFAFPFQWVCQPLSLSHLSATLPALQSNIKGIAIFLIILITTSADDFMEAGLRGNTEGLNSPAGTNKK